ncbi:hypothetical protein MLD38_018238 [Melastoma candidum]|uniref:Uncharacterized protein n=1 Tax=Melastoma candidum TaxID=119954 RepID=A0ACB9QV43_9MYRT|nr:hypothetical protein MLD38_018238 [Melastoma candidum]
MPVNVLFHLRHLSATTGPTMALRRPFFFPSLKLKHAPFLPPPRPRFSVRALSSSPSSFRSGFSRQRTDASRERSRDRVAVRESPKSLVDDEAELSDWVSELRTSSYRGKLTSDEDEDGGGRSMRARNDKRRRGSDDEEPSQRWKDSPSRRYGNEYEGPRRGISDRRVGDRNKGRSTGFRDSMAKRGTGNFESPRKAASFSNDDEEFHRGRSRKGDDRSVGGRNMGRSSSFSKFNGKQGRGDSGRLRKGVAFSDEDDDEEGRFMQGIDGLLSDEETDEDHNDNEGLFRKKSGKNIGDRNKGTSFSKSNGKRVKGGLGSLRRIDPVSDEDDEFNTGMFKKGMDGLISEDDDDEGDEVGHIEEEKNKEKEVNIVGEDSYLSETRFDQCAISLLSLKGIKDAGYEKMTVVQEATLPVILKGKDVLAKAKTGTGKTVAFLLPSIEMITKSPPFERDQKRPPVLVLVICPTRELALQAAKEANTLLKYHPSIGVQVVIGGTRLSLEQKRMQTNPCHILVATPGRLRDHMENTSGFSTRLMGVKVLVLDEADHLLDMGFRRDIERIIAAVPKQRQTLLFSATVPDEVREVCHIALKRDHEFINTVQEGSEETHAQVRQTHLVAPLDKHFALLYALLRDHVADDVNYKVLVFCTTAMVTKLVADLLGELKLNVREIHSRKSQSYRTKVSDEFRKSKGLILVTSDVSARGVDYPDVTLVIQMGLPSDREQYIHRLGRTGRKGKEGLGILMLAPWEEFFLSTIKDLPLSKATTPSVDPDTTKKMERALSHVEMKSKESAYQAWLGYYNSDKKIGKDKYRLVELANEFSRSMGLDSPPAIPKLILGKMGLRNIPGLRSR